MNKIKYSFFKLKLNIFFLLITTSFIGCKDIFIDNSFEIKGQIEGKAPEFIYMSYSNKKDSSKVINGRFSFFGKIDSPTKAQFYIQPASTINKPIYLENKDIEVNLRVDKKDYKGIKVNFISVESVFGTKTAVLENEFEDFKNEFSKDVDWNSKFYKKLQQIISENPGNEYSGDLLSEVALDSVLQNEKLRNLYQLLDTTKQSLNTLKDLKKIIFNSGQIDLGTKMFDFALSDDIGNVISTKSYRGSLLFIDFWASWCAPCIKQFPHLKELYKSFKNNGFEVLGVSINTNSKKWKQSLNRHQLPWNNVIDSLGIKSEILVKYNAAVSIPTNYLIDKNGFIIKMNVSPEELESYLNQKLLVNNK